MEHNTRKKKIRVQKNKWVQLGIVTLTGVAMLLLLCLAGGKFYQKKQVVKMLELQREVWNKRPKIEEALLTPNPYSRPQGALTKVHGVVVHYTANPGTTGWQNRNYFENLGITHETKASSHFIIGLDGTIIQCIPLDEIAYASNERNEDSIAIECCHPKKNGKFTKETYDSLLSLTAWLAVYYNLEKSDIIRHYDITGKICPKYYVEHEDKWLAFQNEVLEKMDEIKKKE